MKLGAILRFGQMKGTEAFFNIAATSDGVCTATAGTGYGLLCFRSDAHHTVFRVHVPEGEKPVIATSDGSIWVGGNSLTRVDIAAHTTKTIQLPENGEAAAFATE